MQVSAILHASSGLHAAMEGDMARQASQHPAEPSSGATAAHPSAVPDSELPAGGDALLVNDTHRTNSARHYATSDRQASWTKAWRARMHQTAERCRDIAADLSHACHSPDDGAVPRLSGMDGLLPASSQQHPSSLVMQQAQVLPPDRSAHKGPEGSSELHHIKLPNANGSMAATQATSREETISARFLSWRQADLLKVQPDGEADTDRLYITRAGVAYTKQSSPSPMRADAAWTPKWRSTAGNGFKDDMRPSAWQHCRAEDFNPAGAPDW